MIFWDKEHANCVNLTIPNHFKKWGLHLSGGADSSLLLYLLGYIIPDDVELTVITANITVKDHTRINRTERVIELCEKLHQKKYITRHVIDNLVLFEDRPKKVMELINGGAVDIVINAVTRNPITTEPLFVETSEGFMWNMKQGEIASRSEENQNPWIKSVDGIYTHVDEKGRSPNTFYSPFCNVDKSYIANIYRKYGLEFNLLPLTRSCEGNKEITNDFKLTCGKCWWCLERKWAFGYF